MPEDQQPGFEIERDWITAAGLRAIAIMSSRGHRCGYVAIDKSHPLHGAPYGKISPFLMLPLDEPLGERGVIPLFLHNPTTPFCAPDVYFSVHGSITFADRMPVHIDGSSCWWFGFDCAHYNDGCLLFWSMGIGLDKPMRSLGYVIGQCESLAQQLIEVKALEDDVLDHSAEAPATTQGEKSDGN